MTMNGAVSNADLLRVRVISPRPNQKMVWRGDTAAYPRRTPKRERLRVA